MLSVKREEAPMRSRTFALATMGTTLIVAGWLVAGCTSGFTSTDSHTYEVNGTIGRLDVRGQHNAIEVTAGDGPVRVTETVKYHNGRPTTSHTTDAGTLRLRDNGCGDHHLRCEVDYSIQVPADTAVDIDDSAGSIRLTGLAGDVTVQVSAGSVEATGMSSAHTTVRNSAGRIELRYSSVPTTVEVTNEAGAIEVSVPASGTYAVDAHTEAGRTRVDVPQDASSAHTISAHDEAGAITIGT
jgi:hypothetical protein